MKFSFIIPVYNGEQYVFNCFKSLCDQTYEDYEVIFVDDGSTDKSGEILDKIASENPGKVKVLHQKNSRQLISRINGVKASSGEYIVFLDVDDAVSPNALKFLSEKIEEYNSPDAVIYPFYYEYENGEKVSSGKLFPTETTFNEKNKRELLHKFLTTTLLNNVYTKAVKSSVLKGGNYPDYGEYKDLLVSEDRLYSLGAMDNVKTAVCLTEPLYFYRITEGSVTRTYNVNRIERLNSIRLYDIEKQYFLKWGFNGEEDLKRFEAQWFNAMIYHFDKFFNNVKTLKERKEVFAYPWERFLKSADIKEFELNPFISPTHVEWFKWIKGHKFFKMEFYMLKKRLLKKLRSKKV